MGRSGSVVSGLAEQTIFSKTKRPPFFLLPQLHLSKQTTGGHGALSSRNTTAQLSPQRRLIHSRGPGLRKKAGRCLVRVGPLPPSVRLPLPRPLCPGFFFLPRPWRPTTSRGVSAMSADAISGFLFGLPQPTTAPRPSPAPTFFYFGTPGQHHLYSCRPG